jgi:hypothetical protein
MMLRPGQANQSWHRILQHCTLSAASMSDWAVLYSPMIHRPQVHTRLERMSVKLSSSRASTVDLQLRFHAESAPTTIWRCGIIKELIRLEAADCPVQAQHFQQ